MDVAYLVLALIFWFIVVGMAAGLAKLGGAAQ